ncbi:dihydrodipicolinate synthase family protein [Pusillimonas sp.]|uniref:dihydrodipicolinate synthase family protein n=1 Tax=Pusillimonas sp. TaxID=3040095 RepID=UPI0037CC2B47
MKVTYEDIVGVVGIVPTPATTDASHWNSTKTINLSETEKMIKLVTAAGVDVLMTNGTFGEGATLLEDEHLDFVRCVVETNARSRPVFAGITTLNTRDTLRRARDLLSVGADGLFVGRPMWLALDDAGLVRFYQDLAEALPDTPLIVYDNPLAFKGKISPEAYEALANIPQVIAAKHVGGPTLPQDLAAVGDRMRILPLATEWCPVAERYPDLAKACWSGGIACAPSPIVAASRAILAGNWEKARKITEQLIWAEAPMFPGGELTRFMDYSIQIGHVRFEAAGLINPGPPRPPYTELPDAYKQGAEECGSRWASLEREYSVSA